MTLSLAWVGCLPNYWPILRSDIGLSGMPLAAHRISLFLLPETRQSRR